MSHAEYLRAISFLKQASQMQNCIQGLMMCCYIISEPSKCLVSRLGPKRPVWARAIATKSQREPVRAGEQARVVQKEPQRAREEEALVKRKSLWQIYLGHSRAPTASLSGSLRPSVAHYSPLISLIKSFLDSQGPCLARRAAATLTHFIPIWERRVKENVT